MFLFVLQFPNVKENNEYKPSLPNFNLNSLNNLKWKELAKAKQLKRQIKNEKYDLINNVKMKKK